MRTLSIIAMLLSFVVTADAQRVRNGLRFVVTQTQ